MLGRLDVLRHLNTVVANRKSAFTTYTKFFALATVCLTLVGCSGTTFPPYSADIKYKVRTDPVFDKVPPNDAIAHIDRPGILPVSNFKDFDNPDGPFVGPKEKDFLKDALNKTIKDPNKMDAELRKKLDETLTEWFGTPAKPVVRYDLLTDVDQDKAESLELQPEILAAGSRLYRVHCLHCHGVMGDGRGVTAKWVNPHPRDYRPMKYKFTSVKSPSGVPSRKDLHRVIEYGLDGTSMPSFVLLKPEEIKIMVSYVMHLSLRGFVEYNAISQMVMQDGKLISQESDPVPSWNDWFVKGMSQFIAANTADNELKPAQYALKFYPQSGELHEFLSLMAKKDRTADEEKQFNAGKSDFDAFKKSVQDGYVNFMEKEKGNCRSCHINFGRDAKYRFDVWATLVKPRDLTVGQYRGGRRPHDLYYRVMLGINPSGMPVAQEYFVKNPAAIWDTLNFVQLLPILVKPEMQEAYGIDLQKYKEAPKAPEKK